MHQQINLFQPVFRKQQKVFSATTLAQIAAMVLVLLIAILGHVRWTLASMGRSAEALQQQHDHIRKQIGALEASYQTPDTKTLDTEIEQLMANIDQRNKLLMQFGQLMIQHRRGFAEKFKALAEQHIPGLWLEGVRRRRWPDRNSRHKPRCQAGAGLSTTPAEATTSVRNTLRNGVNGTHR